MLRRTLTAFLLAAALLALAGCQNKKANNPLAHINSKQPDKILFDRAMDAMKQRKYDVARITLQTLINTYPDSEFVARAKLTVGEAWYQEGTSSALAQAETEFRDFITFFPNMAEASEAQLKIADIHYRQMEKPDRDYTHAMRAEDEYRQLLLQYPDSKLAETARTRLLEVQEVLAERQYRIAHFYFMRGSLIAAMARAKTLTDSYPSYSHSDEALYLLGQAYEEQAQRTGLAQGIPESVKKKLVSSYQNNAAAAYTKLVSRYPVMPRANDAKQRLGDLKRPVPVPTPEAIALNKKELASRIPNTRYERFITNMSKHPDLSSAVRVGQPVLVNAKETDAPSLVREINSTVKAGMEGNKISVAAVGDGKPPESQPAPRTPVVNPSDVPAQAPAQLNEAASSSATEQPAAAGSSTSEATKDESAASSQKKKKKHHLKLPLPF
jgi:outer membrane protein assembly factor BamD